jgi:hypothetical protein
MNDGQSEAVGDGEQGPGQGKVLSLDTLATQYDFTAPDMYVGSDRSDYVLDYGQPVILADSHVEQPYRIRAELGVWELHHGIELEQESERRWRGRAQRLKALWTG